MLAPVLFIVAFMLALTGALLESANRSAAIVGTTVAARYADVTIADGVADFSHGLAAYVAQYGSAGPWPQDVSRSAPQPVCAAPAASCPFTYQIEATITSASGVASAGATDPAPNLQGAINEQRLSAIVTTTVSRPGGAVAARRTRFLTYRVFTAPPYAVIAGSRDITTVDGRSASAQGDSGGDDSPALTAPPGGFDDTRIHVRLTCTTVIPSVVVFVNDQQTAGNDGLPWGNADGAAHEVPCTTPDEPVDDFHDERWHNGDTNTSGWTQ